LQGVLAEAGWGQNRRGEAEAEEDLSLGRKRLKKTIDERKTNQK